MAHDKQRKVHACNLTTCGQHRSMPHNLCLCMALYRWLLFSSWLVNWTNWVLWKVRIDVCEMVCACEFCFFWDGQTGSGSSLP